jgi:hypothetical protein
MERHYLHRSWVRADLKSGKSAISGTGVFAQAPIRQGEKLMEFGGKLISREEMLTENYRIRSIWPVGQGRYIAQPLTDDLVTLDEYLNHSCDANAWLEDEVTLTARRDIAAGEEITLDQGTWNIEDAYTEFPVPAARPIAGACSPKKTGSARTSRPATPTTSIHLFQSARRARLARLDVCHRVI